MMHLLVLMEDLLDRFHFLVEGNCRYEFPVVRRCNIFPWTVCRVPRWNGYLQGRLQISSRLCGSGILEEDWTYLCRML